MDFQSAMETFAEAWVAANTGKLGPGFVSGLSGGDAPSPIYTADSKGNSPGTPLQQQLGGKSGGPLFSAPLSNPTPNPKNINNNIHSQLNLGAGRSMSHEVGGINPPTLSPEYNNQKQNHGISHSHSGSYQTSCPSPSGIDLSPTRRLKASALHQQQRKTPPNSSSQGANGKEMDPSTSGGQYTSTSSGKSMPIHCVIEVSRDLGKPNHHPQDSPPVNLGCRSSPLGGNGEDTINVIKDSSDGSVGKVVVDEFVIIPAGTPFQDVVTTVLSLLGYPKDIIRQAEGTISLRNWKPLRLDQVCDSPHKTVGDILNDLTNYATLRVLVTRAKGGTTDDLKEKLLRLLLAQSSTLLLGAGCPLDEVMLKQLVKGQWPQNLAEDVKRRFDQWYAAQHHQTVTGLVESLQQNHSHLSFGGGGHLPPQQIGSSGPGHGPSPPHSTPSHNSMAKRDMNVSPIRRDGLGSHLLNGLGGLSGSSLSSNPHHHHHHAHSLEDRHQTHLRQLDHHQALHASTNKSPFMEDGLNDVIRHNHPVFHGLSAQKTRMRTSFDPEMELPKLQQWFADNPHPSRHQIQQYVRELNLLDCRKDRKPLDINNVIYWFKNARAAQKRNELRYNGIPGHHQPFLSANLSHQQQLQLHGQYSQSGLLVLKSSRHSPTPSREEDSGPLRNDTNSHRSSGNDNENSTSTCNSDREDQEEYLHTNNENKDPLQEMKSSSTGEDRCQSVTIKEEFDEDFISVEDVSLTAPVKSNAADADTEISQTNNEEPKDLSSKSPTQGDSDGENNNKLSSPHMITADIAKNDDERMEDDDQESSSTSLSPRSSPGLSPNHHFDFGGPPTMVNRLHPFLDHPSFMAYRQFNSFNFGQHFPESNSMGNSNESPVTSAAAAAYENALTPFVNRKNLGLPMGKLSHGGTSGGPLDIFHEFPHGLISSHRALAHHESLARLRNDEMFSPRSASSADIISSFINSNRGDLNLSSLALGGGSPGQNSLALDERRKRNRTFIDPVTEVPRLEQWFGINTHPSHNLILKYTDELNRMPYRQKFPRLESKNVQFWFKNRRAKVKRVKSH